MSEIRDTLENLIRKNIFLGPELSKQAADAKASEISSLICFAIKEGKVPGVGVCGVCQGKFIRAVAQEREEAQTKARQGKPKTGGP